MDPRSHDKPADEKDERDLFFVVKMSSALGLGTMAGFLYSLKEVHPHVRIEVGVGAAVTSAITAVVAWMFCGTMARADAEAETVEGRQLGRKRFFRRWLTLFATVCGAGTLVAFARSLRNVGAQGRTEVIIGTAMAVVVLTCGGWLIHRAVRFFEAQDRESMRRDQDDAGDN